MHLTQVKNNYFIHPPLLVERYMRQGGLTLAAGRVRSKKNELGKKITQKNIRPTQNTSRNPQQIDGRDQLETA